MEDVGGLGGEGDNRGCDKLVWDNGSGVKLCGLIVEDEVSVEYANGEVIGEDLVPSHDGFSTPDTMRVEDVGMEGEYCSPVNIVETRETEVGSNRGSGCNLVEPPSVGMVFQTWQDVELYYKEYAQQLGFGVSRVAGVKSKTGVRDRIASTWRCECWGRPDMRAVREAKKRAKAMELGGTVGKAGEVLCDDELSKRKRKSKKCECQAMIYAGRSMDGSWVIRKVVLEHTNHSPKPDQAQLVKEYRMKKLTSSVRRKLLKFFDRGIPVSQIHGCIESDDESEEDERVQLTVKDLQHEVYKARRLKMVGGDAVAMFAFFEQMQAENQNFFYAQRVDDKGRLKDVLWVDARSRASYEEFGDVVCFDATYVTNKYDLPFVNFVGVNHHGQTILLGCGLVSHEDCDTFTWVFKQWLCCMNNRAPLAILTDQAAAMRKPLEETMPDTRHRWCIWHIMKKIPDKLGKCARYTELKTELKCVVYESLTIMEFEERWNVVISHYKLERNEWLTHLFKERHMWVPAFMKEYFWAGMKTTQRVESINSFFDEFLNRETKLCEFPLKYSQAMRKRVRDEMDADANCSKYIRRLATGYKVEKVFQKIYTDRKFQEVQTECIQMNYCYPREVTNISDELTQYLLEDRVWIVLEGCSEEIITDRRRYYCAVYNKETFEVLCDCRKFQTHGIMCKHMMRVLDINMVHDIPAKYILNRWRKDIMRKHSLVKVSYHDPAETVEVKRYKKLMSAFEPICDVAAMVDDATVEIVLSGLREVNTAVVKRQAKKLEQTIGMTFPGEGNTFVNSLSDDAGDGDDVGCTATTVPQSTEVCGIAFGIESTPHTPVGDPLPKTRPRGRPKGSRNKKGKDGAPARIEDPVPIKRGRGRPKGTRHKTLQEIGYKIPSKRKSRKQNEVESETENVDLITTPVQNISNGRRNTRSSKKWKASSCTEHDLIGLDQIPEGEIIRQYTASQSSSASLSF